MNNLDRYFGYIDETYELIVKHLVERKLPVTDERIRLYFNSIIRPYYFWAQEENQKPRVFEQDGRKIVDMSGKAGELETPPRAPAKMITSGQLAYLKDLRRRLKKKATDEYLQGLSFAQASALIDDWKGEIP